MPLAIKRVEGEKDFQLWDGFVLNHPDANVYQLSGWQTVIRNAYGHDAYYLMAIRRQSSQMVDQEKVVGVLPLVHMKSWLFGNKLVSIPFFDMGGLVVDDLEVGQALTAEAVRLSQRLKVDSIELRQHEKLIWLENWGEDPSIQACDASNDNKNIKSKSNIQNKTNKVRMVLGLPESSQELMKSFKAKLRSQIKKPIKEGLTSNVGGLELLTDFYRVFSTNMRDLGSPVHAKALLSETLTIFSQKARIVMVYHEAQPVAGSVVVGFNTTLENPWASALRQFSRLAPNMLLYWAMLEYACDNGYKFFDFGRSTPNEGTFKFKKQWGSEAYPLFWTTISANDSVIEASGSEKSKFETAIKYWKKLPLPVSKILGPIIRKNISL